ncbi:MAG TPA: tRNA glutamyl-Q(34) synthetase GluQRS [Marinobacterium sp.]|nr:tRNA glutamyl-Q(34) synthetase GluQRS [Marinobacterium sp.]
MGDALCVIQTSLRDMSYRGRFAPSPTGPLHAGSILTAVASYLDAKASQGTWLVRIEDLDPPRTQAGAEQAILQALEAYALEWDEAVLRQSERLSIYQDFTEQLLANQSAYYCSCSRSELKRRGALQHYDGHCLQHPPIPVEQRAIRAKGGLSAGFTDLIQGSQDAEEVSDFIIFRRDGLFAYQLAVVVDDHLQQINQIVRGKDLLLETPKQQILMQRLKFSQVKNYAHLPLVLAKDGQKLSKQTFAKPVAMDIDNIRNTLIRTLFLLGLKPPSELIYNDLSDIYTWAITHWNIDKVPKDINL